MIDQQWALVTIAGFWGWVFCTVGFILKVFPRQKQFVSRAALQWGAAIVLFFCLWFVGMLNA
jgi:hypothetical protein